MSATGCIKHGAMVHFTNYSVAVLADVFRVGNCIVVKTHPGQVGKSAPQKDLYQLRLDIAIGAQTSGENVWDCELGIFVVPEHSVLFYTAM